MLRGILLLGSLSFLAPPSVTAATLTFPLTPAESSCAEQELARVERRLASYGSGAIATSLGTNSIWLAMDGGAGTAYAGIVRLIDNGGDAFSDFAAGTEHFTEADLAFKLLFTPTESLLDPHQPPAPQALLARRDTGTNLLADSAACGTQNPLPQLDCPIVLNFDLSAVPGDSVHPQLPLVVNSASIAVPDLTGLQASPLSAASGSGPGIDTGRLDQPCGGTLTSFDQHVFEILARTIVPSDCYSTVPATCGNPVGTDLLSYNLAIFRGADPHTYRVNIYPYEYVCSDQNVCYSTIGPLALEFAVDWDSQGHLTTGSVKVLPRCRAAQTFDCTQPYMQFGVFLVPPIFPGQEEELPAAFHGAPYLYVAGINDPSPEVLTAPINWQRLLSGTALNTP
jgi:hypothetical protein